MVDEKVIYSHFGQWLRECWIGDQDLYKTNRPIVFQRNMKENDVFADENIPKTRALTADVLFNSETGIVQRIIDRWVVVNTCYSLCPEERYQQYDVVIRSRPDSVFSTPLPLVIEEGVHIGRGDRGYTERYNPAEPDCVPYVVDDRMGWGHPKWMRKYFEFCHYIQPLYDQFGTDISYAEHMLARYLIKYPYFSKTIPDMMVTIHDDVVCGLTDGRFLY